MGMWRTRRKHSDNGSETRQEKNSKPVKESPESVFDILNTKKRTEITQREPEPVLQVVKALHAFLPHPDRSFYDYYDKAEELGNGVTSVVYKCINRKSGKEYACKEMDKTKASPVQLQSIQSEVEIMLSIEDHAGVVGLNDIFEDDNVSGMEVIPLFWFCCHNCFSFSEGISCNGSLQRWRVIP